MKLIFRILAIVLMTVILMNLMSCMSEIKEPLIIQSIETSHLYEKSCFYRTRNHYFHAPCGWEIGDTLQITKKP